jgi:hypothetical protein
VPYAAVIVLRGCLNSVAECVSGTSGPIKTTYVSLFVQSCDTSSLASTVKCKILGSVKFPYVSGMVYI